ncbi:alkyl sulfatase dimerization domain-containing protein [Streptomyces sp. NPDC087917]|uniref:alkyl sulfatase dimerization domain-containing protein n=1 Tax=Streptomyces sp. NPDC087917 TaxID=3155060 RepID=UPI00342B545C
MAENATHNMHNILTLRGAVVRDTRVWAHYLDETITLFGDRGEVAFASHHWPTWGRERIVEHLARPAGHVGVPSRPDLRMTYQGLTGTEIAERMVLPPAIANRWANRRQYGSVSHNVKAIYQRYMGWFDGNPARLWEHPPVEQAKRFAADYGGVSALIAKGEEYAASGDLRFAATLLGHAVFAAPEDNAAERALASVYEKLGYGAENGTWRNFYLMGAQELRGTVAHTALETTNPEMAMALTVDMPIDSLAIRVDGPRAWDEKLTMDWNVTDAGRTWGLLLSNGALIHRSTATETDGPVPAADRALTLTERQLLAVLAGKGLDGVHVQGDPQVLTTLLDTPHPDFAVVTP